MTAATAVEELLIEIAGCQVAKDVLEGAPKNSSCAKIVQSQRR